MPDIYFDNRKLPTPRKEYVAFIDLMGIENHMHRSVKDTSNFIFKLHAAVVSAWRKPAYQGVFVYPIMDGVYITSKSKENIEKILVKIHRELAELFVNENNILHQVIPRCGLSYGKIIHGHDVPYQASKVFELDLEYKNSILLGQPMIDAYEYEKEAAPFGISVHETAIKQTGAGTQFGAFSNDWKWYKSTEIKVQEDLIRKLNSTLENYYRTVKDEAHPLHYPIERILDHEQKAKEYFSFREKDI